ncbi:hypothetical protein WJX79_003661 [Trebouxia sp. C0005]
MPTAHAYNQRRTEPFSVRFVHSIASAFAAAEFELLVICLFFVVAYALKAALVVPDPYSQAFTSKPMLARET